MKKSRQTTGALALLEKAIGLSQCAPSASEEEIREAIVAYGNQRVKDAAAALEIMSRSAFTQTGDK